MAAPVAIERGDARVTGVALLDAWGLVEFDPLLKIFGRVAG